VFSLDADYLIADRCAGIARSLIAILPFIGWPTECPSLLALVWRPPLWHGSSPPNAALFRHESGRYVIDGQPGSGAIWPLRSAE